MWDQSSENLNLKGRFLHASPMCLTESSTKFESDTEHVTLVTICVLRHMSSPQALSSVSHRSRTTCGRMTLLPRGRTTTSGTSATTAGRATSSSTRRRPAWTRCRSSRCAATPAFTSVLTLSYSSCRLGHKPLCSASCFVCAVSGLIEEDGHALDPVLVVLVVHSRERRPAQKPLIFGAARLQIAHLVC